MIRKRTYKIYIFLGILLGNIGHTAYGSEFFKDTHWDQGKAEYQSYTGSVTKYNEKRNSEHLMIIIKENFDEKKNVKSNKGKKEVIKYNYLSRIPTGTYDYRQMMSMFFDRESGEVIKFTMSSQDGCGHTYMEYNKAFKDNTLHYYSYMDDQGKINEKLPKKDFVFYDSLPVYLRFKLEKADKKKEFKFNIDLLSSLIRNKYRKPVLQKAEVSVQRSDVGSSDKTGFSKYIVTVTTKKGTDRYIFGGNYPYMLLEWEKSNGDKLSLNKTFFIDYWNKKSVEDSKIYR